MSQPTSTPPGGGSWTWDEVNSAWLPATAPDAPQQQATPAEPASPAAPE